MINHSDILLQAHYTILIDISWTTYTLSLVVDKKKKKKNSSSEIKSCGSLLAESSLELVYLKHY